MWATGEHIHPKNNQKCVVMLQQQMFTFSIIIISFIFWYTDTTLWQQHEVWNIKYIQAIKKILIEVT